MRQATAQRSALTGGPRRGAAGQALVLADRPQPSVGVDPDADDIHGVLASSAVRASVATAPMVPTRQAPARCAIGPPALADVFCGRPRYELGAAYRLPRRYPSAESGFRQLKRCRSAAPAMAKSTTACSGAHVHHLHSCSLAAVAAKRARQLSTE